MYKLGLTKKYIFINLMLLKIDYKIQHAITNFWLDCCLEIQPIKIKLTFTLWLTALVMYTNNVSIKWRQTICHFNWFKELLENVESDNKKTIVIAT
jgi:hypothetical protein